MVGLANGGHGEVVQSIACSSLGITQAASRGVTVIALPLVISTQQQVSTTSSQYRRIVAAWSGAASACPRMGGSSCPGSPIVYGEHDRVGVDLNIALGQP